MYSVHVFENNPGHKRSTGSKHLDVESTDEVQKNRGLIEVWELQQGVQSARSVQHGKHIEPSGALL